MNTAENNKNCKEEDHDYDIINFTQIMYQGDLCAIIHKKCKICNNIIIETPW
jgi:hypothetical protein